MQASPDKRQAFEGLAKNDNHARPDYPRLLYDAILTYWRKHHHSNLHAPIIVDVGCGTGISTRAFHKVLKGHCQITGIEPGKDMLATARTTSSSDIFYQEGDAENLPFSDHTIDIVTAAQAIQWFNRPLFYQQAQRVLKTGGVIALYENNRDWQNSAFLTEYEEMLEVYSVNLATQERYSRYYRDFSYETELAKYFGNVKTLSFFWDRKMTPKNFVLMAKTSTQVQRAIKAIGLEKFEQRLFEHVQKYSNSKNQILVQYHTKLYLANCTKQGLGAF